VEAAVRRLRARPGVVSGIEARLAIVVYNDHGADFAFDKYPTFALGVAERYAIGDEGSARGRCPKSPATVELSTHLRRR